MQISAMFLRALYLDLHEHGISTEPLLAALQLPAMPANYALIEASTMARAIAAAEAAGARPGLALRLGASTALRVLGMFGQLLLQCPTPREALLAAQRFMPLLQTDGELLLTESGSMAALHYDARLSSGPGSQFATELAFAFAVTLARRYLGERTCPQGVLLPFSAPAHQEAYAELFRCPVVFDSHCAALIFDSAMLDAHQPFSDCCLRELLTTELEGMLARGKQDVPMHRRLRALLEQRRDGLHKQKLSDISRMLGLSRRAVRRRLAAEGQSFAQVLSHFRRDQATRLLKNENMALKDVADTMGYSDQSAFHRAFRRWTGETPRQFRLNLTARAPAGDDAQTRLRVSSSTRAAQGALPT